MGKIRFIIALTALSLAACGSGKTNTEKSQYKKILNVSYDVSRDFFKAYNPLFIEHFSRNHPHIDLHIQQSHGGSSKQAMSVANGLPADVVTMNQTSDIDSLQQRGLVKSDWTQRLPNNAVPFSSVTVFLVRKGNPQNVYDWADLARDNLQVVFANPKTSGNGRYAFLGAYGYGLKANNGNEADAKNFMRKLLNNVPMFENGSRAATTSFTQRQIGDVLITLENEANIVSHHLAPGQFDIVYPSYTVEAQTPVAVVDSVADKKDSAAISKEYLAFLWSKPAQELAAELYFRPSDKSILSANHADFPDLETFRPDETLGTWSYIMQKFFADGGMFDELTTTAK
ncbi:sulfate ABC transporter substrate-binding protein [Neisseria sp. N95_16]|uniref:Sulfate ABC transporter substrate-binding protein n=1 Tax=Neisseria brasiliensis TaxID=2666100 RepID=A0A5Q3RUA6_9NEIS|nr:MULTISPECIES: sulfate ABC transporter substrate-binding protein [Neisseria]MRN36966.1 sulfate ABC transporter substrate-binding protein [Neisseria brasiliensis]PJO10117.1 sulfate ABC transporter substrate-binding protein [Neisseria sp. N95_16]PJO78359.1 sulfate ABC transporter substrate-binding protein [Neisseria sp. N177_16]QGL24102.1 sulfate ABC transporter substrate-binding protein [Neisseria brasiliensis]